MIATTLEQSKKLLEIGIDPSTADMYWWYSGKRYYLNSMDDNDFNGEDIPAWSLSALLELMPITIEDDYLTYYLKIDMEYKTPRYTAIDCYHSDFPWFGKDNLIDNVVESIIWLKENKYI